MNGIPDDAGYVIANGATGKITGSQVETITDGSDVTHVFSTITGKVVVKGAITGAGLKSSGTFTGTFSGTAKGKSIAVIDPSALTIVSDLFEKLSVHGGRSRSFSSVATTALPSGMNGHWTLDMDITNDVDNLGGTGTLTLSNDRTFTYTITGTYKSTTGISKLKFVGEGDAVGTGFLIATQGTNMDLTALKGKILGQKPTFP